jgi:hypothetical protein
MEASTHQCRLLSHFVAMRRVCAGKMAASIPQSSSRQGGSWQLAVGSWQLAVGSWQLAVGSWEALGQKLKSVSIRV